MSMIYQMAIKLKQLKNRLRFPSKFTEQKQMRKHQEYIVYFQCVSLKRYLYSYLNVYNIFLIFCLLYL